MPEKVTLEYCSYILGAHNHNYVKLPRESIGYLLLSYFISIYLTCFHSVVLIRNFSRKVEGSDFHRNRISRKTKTIAKLQNAMKSMILLIMIQNMIFDSKFHI